MQRSGGGGGDSYPFWRLHLYNIGRYIFLYYIVVRDFRVFSSPSHSSALLNNVKLFDFTRYFKIRVWWFSPILTSHRRLLSPPQRPHHNPHYQKGFLRPLVTISKFKMPVKSSKKPWNSIHYDTSAQSRWSRHERSLSPDTAHEYRILLFLSSCAPYWKKSRE